MKGDTIHFTYDRSDDGVNWDTTLVLNGNQSTLVTDTYPLAYKRFDQVLFAIELYDQVWDFGAVVFRNVVITTDGLETEWCTE